MSNNPGLQQVDTASYRNQIANATTKYQMYSRGMLASGQQPMSFDSFLQRSAQGMSSPDITQPLEYGRSLAQAKSAEKRGPTFAQRYRMSQMYGIRMDLGNDIQSLAASGNRNALEMYKAQQDNAAEMAKLSPKPSIDQSVQMHGLVSKILESPRNAFDQVIESAQRDGSWANAGARSDILKRAEEAQRYAAQSANEQLSRMQRDPNLSFFFAQNQSNNAQQPMSQYGLAQPSPMQNQQPQSQLSQYGLAPDQRAMIIESAQVPVDVPAANTLQAFEAYRALKNALGRDPSPDEVSQHLNGKGLAMPPKSATAGIGGSYYDKGAATGAWFPDALPQPMQSDYSAYTQWMRNNNNIFGPPPSEPKPFTITPRNFMSPHAQEIEKRVQENRPLNDWMLNWRHR